MTTRQYSSESGQVLILVTLVLLVGLTVGLSLAARSISNIQNSGDLDQSNRAFSAAEAGIEHALVNCPTVNPNCVTSPIIYGVDSQKVAVTNVGGTTGIGYYIPTVAQDDVAQLTLGSTYTSSSVDIYWDGKTGGPQPHPAIVVSVLNNSSGTYSLTKYAYDEKESTNLNNFTPLTCNYSGPSIAAQDGKRYTLPCHVTINGITTNTVLMRVRFMYNSGSIIFAPASGQALPSQGKLYTSTATVNGKQRTVTAFQSNPQLPAIFDYAIFNGSSSPLTK